MVLKTRNPWNLFALPYMKEGWKLEQIAEFWHLHKQNERYPKPHQVQYKRESTVAKQSTVFYTAHKKKGYTAKEIDQLWKQGKKTTVKQVPKKPKKKIISPKRIQKKHVSPKPIKKQQKRTSPAPIKKKLVITRRQKARSPSPPRRIIRQIKGNYPVHPY